ncbi:MAG: hypothetical protein GXP17_06725 [Gammaproteobacteria bacterium]|nr:hypothetical protein [Gammaproteobacteria bacterium]
MAVYDVNKLMAEARKLAADFRRATGKPLGISNEIAVHDVIRLMKLVPAEPGAGGYDAIGTGECEGRRIQIKGRTVFTEPSREKKGGKKTGQRIGQIKMDQEWDSVMLILMDDNYDACEIYEAAREAIVEASAEGSAKRAKRGAMSVARFKAIGALVWSREQSPESPDEPQTPADQPVL